MAYIKKFLSFVREVLFYTFVIGIAALALYAGYIIYGVANELWGVFDVTRNEFLSTYDLDKLVRIHNELVSNEKLGTFGDFIGGTLNPILTFLTFICLIVTIWMQRTELNLTRKELKKSAEEQARSANAANSQVAEATIFNLINLHRSIFNDVIYKEDEKTFTSIEAFRYFSGSFCDDLDEQDDFFTKNELEYFDIVKNKNYIFGSYFRVLYQILSTIDSYPSDLLSDDKKLRYAKVLRSYLSTPELTLLMINSFSKVCDDGQFKFLLIKYEMLKHLPISNSNKAYDFNGFVVDFYTIGNSIDIPEYFLYEYVIQSNTNGDSMESAFGCNSDISKYIANKIDHTSPCSMLTLNSIMKYRLNEKLSDFSKRACDLVVAIDTLRNKINSDKYEDDSKKLAGLACLFADRLIEFIDFIKDSVRDIFSAIEKVNNLELFTDAICSDLSDFEKNLLELTEVITTDSDTLRAYFGASRRSLAFESDIITHVGYILNYSIYAEDSELDKLVDYLYEILDFISDENFYNKNMYFVLNGGTSSICSSHPTACA